jgi:Holliday junction resolvase RusA-like endonuclease
MSRARATPAPRLPAGTVVASFTVLGRAVPWTPSRVTKNGTYKPLRVRRWQRQVSMCAKATMLLNEQPAYGGPVYLSAAFEFRKGPLADWDNLTKTAVDAIQGIAIVNDRQVEDARVSRKVGDVDRVSVRVVAI